MSNDRMYRHCLKQSCCLTEIYDNQGGKGMFLNVNLLILSQLLDGIDHVDGVGTGRGGGGRLWGMG